MMLPKIIHDNYMFYHMILNGQILQIFSIVIFFNFLLLTIHTSGF